MDADCHFFSVEPTDEVVCPNGLPGYECYVWRPSAIRYIPPTGRGLRFMVWWLFHVLHIFANRSYRVIVISHEGTPVHRSCIFPGYFRFPFMESQDLQVGDTWTSPEHRGKGLATWGLCEAIKVAQKSGGRVWYLVDDDNPASIRVCTKVGMRQVGTGRRTRRMGLRLFGAYVMEGNHDG